MKLNTIILFLTLLTALSCREQGDVQFKAVNYDDTRILSEYILPLYRKELMSSVSQRHLYRISIKIDRKEQTAEAVAQIRFYNGSGMDLNEIQLRLLMNGPSISPMTINSIDVDEIPVQFKISADSTTLIIPMKRTVEYGKSVSFKIHYSIDFKTDPGYYFGFARIDKDGFSIPHFYPTVSRFVDGDWEADELVSGGDILSADSSWFMVDIETDDKIRIMTSGKEISSEEKGGKQKKAFVAGPVRDFFIAGAGSFIPQVTISGETRIISYSHNSESSISMKTAQIVSSAVSLFNSKFGVLPFGELKIVSLPMTALGIEYPGLFAIQQDLYSNSTSFLFEPTVVHETAHQWFYSLLGNNQLLEPWIDEGFSQYATWLFYREQYGSSAALQFFNSFTRRWDKVDRREIPINKPVGFYNKEEYASIIYGRAPLFLIEVQNTMGEEKFHRFIRHLITNYSHRILTTELFKKEIIHFAGSSIDPLFESYFDFEGE